MDAAVPQFAAMHFQGVGTLLKSSDYCIGFS
jgi:hypothetical protein